MRKKNIRPKRKRAPLLTLALILLIAGAAAILVPVLTVDLEIHLDTEEYALLREQSRGIAAEEQEMPQAGPPDAAMPSSVIPETGITPQNEAPIMAKAGRTGVDMASCKAENDDFVAWLQIPGTTVDYPVVLSNDTEYYLHHTFSGKKSYLGTLFSLARTDYHTPGKNIGIYGHHIRSNKEVMFSPLISYKDEDYYAGHETIYLDSLYHSDTYTVFAVINMRSGDFDPAATEFASDEDFLRFIQRVKSLSLYDTGVEVTADDQVLTLITCDRSYIPTYGRLVVMAVKED